MNREEFMKELSGLLSDLSVEEKQEALEYYTNYFDEAGSENEQSVIEELQSPEAVSVTIKKGLFGENYLEEEATQARKEAAEAKAMAEREKESAEAAKKSAEQARAAAVRAERERDARTKNMVDSEVYAQERKANQTLKTVLIVLLLIFTFPIWITVLAVLFALVVGLLAVILGCSIALVACTIGCLLGGCVVMGMGFVVTFSGVAAAGLVMIGAGLISIALGILGVVMIGWIFGKFYPWVFMGLVHLIQKPFKKKEAAAQNTAVAGNYVVDAETGKEQER